MFSRTEPGLPISTALHAALLAAVLISFTRTPKFDDTLETVSVEIVSTSELNQVSKGEKSAPQAKPSQRAEKAEQAETRPTPPQREAKRDVPAPTPQLKRLAEPNDEDAPVKPEKQAPTPPRRVAALERPAPEKPAPTPPVRAKTTPEPEEQPDEAEVVKPKPPTRPKIEKVEEKQPTPPEKPKEKPRLKTDEVAKLLQQREAKAAAATKPRSGDESAPKSKFNATNIANFLSHEPAQQRGSTARQTQLASLGTPTGAAPKLSPSMEARIGQYIKDHYQPCWKSGLSLGGETYSPVVRFHLTRDGNLDGSPKLLSHAGNAVEQARSTQAVQAIRRCSPMKIPAEFMPYYEEALHEVDIKFTDVD
jgi:colicin import membrane protein